MAFQVEVKKLVQTNKKMVIIDVRNANDYEDKNIPNTIHLPVNDIENKIDKRTWLFTAYI